MKKNKKIYKLIFILVTLLIIGVLGFLVLKTMFSSNSANRLEGIENYPLTEEEKTAVNTKLTEMEKINSIEIYTNYKIIKIMIELSEDIEFKEIKTVSNEIISCFSDKNLSYYDIEIFINSLNEESEIYPKIGYKHKMNSEFTWNR